MPDQRMRLPSAIFLTDWGVEAQGCMRELLCNTVPDLAAASWHLTGTENEFVCCPRHGHSTREACSISQTNQSMLDTFPYLRGTFMLNNRKASTQPLYTSEMGDLVAQA